MRKLVPSVVAVGMLYAATALASTHNFDLNQDPTGILTFYGSALWQPSGGPGTSTNANDGYLQITAAASSQRSAIVFDDFDGGLIVQGFTFEADFQIGNGTATPADGFCIAYVRANDPVLSVVNNGGNPATASTDPNPPAGAPWIGRGVWATGPNCENNLPEEGTWTGIAIGFDAWNSGGTAPYCYEADQSQGADVRAVDVRVDGIQVLQQPMPTINGTATDATSLQTGPYDGTLSTTPLGWAHLKVDLSASGVLNVWWKGTQILTNYQTAYLPSAGRLVFAGRTGDAYQFQNVDNIQVTTLAATHPIVNTATGFPDGCAITIADSGLAVDITKPYSLVVNGITAPAPTIKKVDTVTTVSYHGYPNLLVSGSTTNSVTVSVTDSGGATVTGTRTFTVPVYPTVPAAWAVTPASVDTARPGFRLLTWQSSFEWNINWWANEQLAGLHGTNQADLTQATDNGYFDYTGVPNFDYAANTDGNFNNNNGYTENLWPGLVTGANGLNNIDHCAADIECFLQFANAGVYYMGVNSDDGFNLTTGPNPADWGALSLGQFIGGRGASDTTFSFVVPTAGIYPFRLMWENGTGGANCEWFSYNPDTGVRILINDIDPTNTTGIKAFFKGPALPAYVSDLYPTPGSSTGDPLLVAAQITDAATAVTQGSVQLSITVGTTVRTLTPTVQSSGGKTTASAYIIPPVPAGSNVTAQLVYGTSGGTFTNTWTYTIAASYPVLDSAWAVTGVNTTQPGFRLRTWQSGVQPNNNWWTEEQLAGLQGENNVDPTLATDRVYGQSYIDYAGLINFDIGTADGNFQTYDDYPEIPFPGLPSLAGLNGSSSLEALCYLYFDHPGLYTMGVNSDDGFKVTAGANPADWLTQTVLGQFNGGRGAANTTFSFLVTNAGYYPFRLIWENGSGESGNGANVEWFMVEPTGTPSLINDPRMAGEFGTAKAYFSGPLLPAFVSLAEPYPGASLVDPQHLFQVNLTDGGTTVTPSTIKLFINGTQLSPVIQKTAGLTTVTMPAPYLLPQGNDTAMLVYSTSSGGPFTNTWSFSVIPWGGLNSAWAVTGVDLNKTGFRVRPWKSSGEVNAVQPNDLRWTEEQLAGAHGNNRADLSGATDNGYIDYADVINWNNSGTAGNFTSANGYADIPFPGSGTATTAWDNCAEEVLTFLKFEVPGVYYMGVNSDDGFKVTGGANPKDWLNATVFGYFNGGRGSADTRFAIVVTNAPAFYPIRLIWENGGGGYNCEWFVFDSGGNRVLVNDPSLGGATGVSAYYSGPNLPAYVSEYWPVDGATGVTPGLFSITLTDGSTTVDPGSITLTLNGIAIAPVITKVGGITKVTLPSTLAPGSNYTAIVSYSTSGGSFSKSWSFTTATTPVVTLSTNLWSPPGSGSNPGFAMKVWQSPATNIFNGWNNLIRTSDQGLQGFYGANVADLTQQTNNGEMWWPGIINFGQNSDGTVGQAGDFQTGDGWSDVAVPGLGTWSAPSGTAKMDHDAWQARMFLEFPAAGAYVFGVASDDCFQLTEGDQCSPGKTPLYVFAPASAAGDMMSTYTTADDPDGNRFGATPPSTVPLVGRAVLTDPINASTVPVNAMAIKGNIAVCYRGANFQTQCRRCFAAGAIAVIGGTYDTDATLPGTRGSADSGLDPAIPCLQVGYPDFQRLTNSITQDASSPVIVRITAQDCSPIIGGYSSAGGRGATDTIFSLNVPQAGLYPFRLIWNNGGGGANCEFFQVDNTTGIHVPINDPACPVKAWITRDIHAPGALQGPAMLAPTLSSGNVKISWTGAGELWEAYSLNGPWFKSTYQSNPSTVVPNPLSSQRFFRVRHY